MLRYLLTLLILLTGILGLRAQNMDLYLVNIKGTVVNQSTGEPIPFAHVINPSQHSGTITNIDGLFSLNMLTEDTLLIKAVGFSDFRFFLQEFPPLNHYTIKIKPIQISIGEVTVEGKNGLKDRLGIPKADSLNIPVELRGSAFNEKPPWFAAFVSPISFAQYYLSKTEKGKRELREIIAEGEQWNQFSMHFNLPRIKKLTGLSGKEADEFMIFCNMNNRLPYDATSMQVDFQILDLFFKYKKMKSEQKIKTDSLELNSTKE